MLLIFLQILASQSLARQAVMAPSNEDQSESTMASVHEKLPYIITEEAGKLNIVFTSGEMKGHDFQIDLSKIPPPVDNGQPQQLAKEPPHPYSFLDGHGNEISEEEYERLAAIEIAARENRETRAAETERGQ